MRHSAIKLEKYTFINSNIQVINTILNVNRDNRQTFKCKHYSLKLFLWHRLKFNSIPAWTALGWIRQRLMHLYNQFEHSLHLICKNQFSVKQYQFRKKRWNRLVLSCLKATPKADISPPGIQRCMDNNNEAKFLGIPQGEFRKQKTAVKLCVGT